MQIGIDWMQPFGLTDATHENIVYSVDLDRLPTEAGLYVFGRRWGNRFEALYVGKANNVQSRVRGQLNNLRLMQHVLNSKQGTRVLFVGTVVTKRGQNRDKVVALAERALIRHFLSEGHDLVNRQGTRIRRHEITAEGRHPRGFIPRHMYVEKGRGK